MTTSSIGVSFIKQYEGCIDHVYLDPIGLPSLGVGHLMSPHELSQWPVGTEIANDLIDSILRDDLKEAEECVTSNVTWDISQNMFDSLVSFVFNIGCGAFKKSTLLKKLNLGLVEDAANEFLRWNRAGQKVLPGLVKRREAERDLFLTQPT